MGGLAPKDTCSAHLIRGHCGTNGILGDKLCARCCKLVGDCPHPMPPAPSFALFCLHSLPSLLPYMCMFSGMSSGACIVGPCIHSVPVLTQHIGRGRNMLLLGVFFDVHLPLFPPMSYFQFFCTFCGLFLQPYGTTRGPASRQPFFQPAPPLAGLRTPGGEGVR